MLNLTDNLWIGNSSDEELTLFHHKLKVIDSVLIVAHDMAPTNGWPDGIEYMQVGIIDGPGNPLAAYHAAVLALAALAKRGKVLVCCHDGGRSLAVAIMYLYLVGEGPSWDESIDRLVARQVGVVPAINDVHKQAFRLMDWTMLSRVVDGEV